MAHRQIIAKAALDGATSLMGQSLPKWNVRVTSAFPLIATEERTSRDVSNVPVTGSCSAANRVVIRSPPRHARTPAGRAVLHLGFRAGWVRAAGGASGTKTFKNS